MKAFRWALINGLFAACLYYGFIENIDGAYNVAMFLAWATVITSLFVSSDGVVKKMKDGGRSVTMGIDVLFDTVVILVFAWFGAWVTATGYFLHAILQQAAWDKALSPNETEPEDEDHRPA